jgi:dTDP-4-dehydrorhamnose reductase
MLGRTLASELGGEFDVFPLDLPECDITDFPSLERHFGAIMPDVVIHAAAMTDVDGCESSPEAAHKVNAFGTGEVAKAAKAVNARLIAISTDYVYGGDAPASREWTESDATDPRTVYGKTKRDGENLAMELCPGAVVLRIAWLYGKLGPSFVHTMARLGCEEGSPIRVVDDQYGNPTSAKSVAEAIRFIIGHREIEGVVHGSCEGIATWYAFACEIKRAINSLAAARKAFVREIVPCTTAEFPRPAPRPGVSSLAKCVLKSAGFRPREWREALAEFVAGEFSR